VLPHRRTRRSGALGALIIALIGALILVPTAQAADSGWKPSKWTGVQAGAPVPGEGLPAAAVPGLAAPQPQGSYDIKPEYEGQTTCDPNSKTGTQKVADLIKATYGANQTVWIPRACDIGGQSEHKEGRALDWMTSVRDAQQRANAETFLNWLLGPDQYGVEYGNAMRLGVMYIGWNDRIWRGYDINRGWAELKGCFSKESSGNDTICHRNHIHISFTWDGASGRSSFWSGVPFSSGFCARHSSGASTPNVSTAGDMIPVAQFTAMDTRSAIGTAKPCRLQQDRWNGDSHRLFPKVAGVSGVPGDAGAVAVHVSALGSNAPSEIRVWSPGQTSSKVAFKVPMNADAGADLTVPIASDGTIAIATSLGATDIVVQVNGYFKAGPGNGQNRPVITGTGPGNSSSPSSSDPAPQPAGPAQSNPTEEQEAFNAIGADVAYDSAVTDGPLQPGEARTVSLAGVPADATSALVVLTANNSTDKGSILVSRSAPSGPVVKFTFPKANARSAVMLVPVSGGKLTFNTSKKPAVDVKVELLGYGAGVNPPAAIGLSPIQVASGKLKAGQAFDVDLGSRYGLPGKKKYRAVMLEVTTNKAEGSGKVVSYPVGATPPTSRSAPIVPGKKRTEIILASTAQTGRVVVSADAGAQVKVRLIGYVK